MVSTRLQALKTTSDPVPNALGPADATPRPPQPSLAACTGTQGGSNGGTLEYERSRDERIRTNMERMRKLGILDLAHTFKSCIAGDSSAAKRPYRRRATPSSSPLSVDLPPRRSSRLQNVTPVSYIELPARREDENRRNTEISLEEGPKDEIYTDEHENLLGTCETNWTLFVDGYNKDRVRIYDPVKGKTCHQCRQKTLGHRTHCSKCKIVQGQFCGDCLYMRYGENVLEANKNPDWTCPVCRGICNCSICRAKKGWAPTGPLYKKVSNLGYRSVAHYLIQTRRGQANIGGMVSANPTSAKRSLPFTDEGPSVNYDSNDDDHCNGQRALLDSDNNKDKDVECNRGEDVWNLDEGNSMSTLEGGKIPRKKLKETESRLIVKPSSESVAGRLRNHRELINCGANHNDGHCDSQSILPDSDNSFQLCSEREEDECGGDGEMQNSERNIAAEKTSL